MNKHWISLEQGLRRTMTTAALGLLSVCMYAGNPVKIKGTVTDSKGEPLVGATIQVPGTAIGTTADIDGHFTLNVEDDQRSEEHTSELQSRQYLVCRLLLEKKKKQYNVI